MGESENFGKWGKERDIYEMEGALDKYIFFWGTIINNIKYKKLCYKLIYFPKKKIWVVL